MAVPTSWQVRSFGGFPEYRDPATGRALRVSTGKGQPDPVADRQAQARSFRVAHPTYAEIGITPTTYQGHAAADWEFTFEGVHVLDRVFVVGGTGYSLWFQAPAAGFAGAGADLAAVLRDLPPGRLTAATASAAGSRRASPPAPRPSPSATPNAGSCGCSRRLRLSSAKPGNEASPTTWSHRRTASSGLGSRLITGPKKATPSGGCTWMIGVPTSLPVSASASSVSARSSLVEVRVVEGGDEAGVQPEPAEQLPHAVRVGPARAGRPPAARGRGLEDPLAHRPVERPDRLRAVRGPHRRGHPEQPEPGRVPRLVLRREVRVVVDRRVEQPQRDEPPLHRVRPLLAHQADPLAGHPGERAHRVEVERQVGVGHTGA